MDLRLNPDEELLCRSARELLARRAPLDKVAAAEGDPFADDPALWAEMASLGWLGLAIPEELGGSGGTVSQLELLAEELGRALCPAPFVAVAAAAAALEAAGGDRAGALLAEVAAGSCRPVLAVTGPTGRVAGAPGVVMWGGGLVGEKGFVDAAATADWFLATATSDDGAVRLVLVDAASPTVLVEPRPTIAGWSTARVTFDGAPVAAVLGDRRVVDAALGRTAALHAGWCAGAAARLLEDTAAYVSSRVQFGVPIGSFQAVQHRLADCDIAVAEAVTLARHAAAALTERAASARRLASTAFVRATDAFVATARHCHQVWGGMGFGTEAHVHLFSRRAKAAQQAWGGTEHHLDVVAEELTVLPLARDRYPRLGAGRSGPPVDLVVRRPR